MELKSRKRFGGKIEKDENKNGGLLSLKKKKVVFMQHLPYLLSGSTLFIYLN